jgi:cell division protein FtsL
MGNALLDMLTIQGQIAFVLAFIALTAVGLVMMLWRPRHATYEQHDCRSMGCQWLKDKPL